MPKERRIEETGKKYGRLTVIKRGDSRPIEGKRGGRAYWFCLCECGNTTEVRGYCLRSGGVKSCGCGKGRALPRGEAALNALMSSMRINAAKRGKKWLLKKEELRLLVSQPCYYCGLPPSQGNKKEFRKDGRQYQPNGNFLRNGVDRLDNSLEYSSDNVVPCCKTCNYAKLKQTVAEFKLWIARAYNHSIRKEEEKL